MEPLRTLNTLPPCCANSVVDAVESSINVMTSAAVDIEAEPAAFNLPMDNCQVFVSILSLNRARFTFTT